MKVAAITPGFVLCLLLGSPLVTEAQTRLAQAESPDKSIRISLEAPETQRVGGRSTITIAVFDLEGPIKKNNLEGFWIYVRLKEKDVLEDDEILSDSYRVDSNESLRRVKKYSVDLIRDRSHHSEIYLEVEVQHALIGGFRTKATTRPWPIRVLKTK